MYIYIYIIFFHTAPPATGFTQHMTGACRHKNPHHTAQQELQQALSIAAPPANLSRLRTLAILQCRGPEGGVDAQRAIEKEGGTGVLKVVSGQESGVILCSKGSLWTPLRTLPSNHHPLGGVGSAVVKHTRDDHTFVFDHFQPQRLGR